MGNRAAEPSADAVVLAGGRASRLGGVDKPGLHVGGRSMLAAAVAAVRGCERVAVVGPHRPELAAHIRQTREIPPGAGPVAALAAGLAALADDPAPYVVVLAADLPFLTPAIIARLRTELHTTGAPATFAADPDGRPQYLIGAWRRTHLESALAALGSPVNHPMKSLVPPTARTLILPGTEDCDTEEQLQRARGAGQADSPAPAGTGTAPLVSGSEPPRTPGADADNTPPTGERAPRPAIVGPRAAEATPTPTCEPASAGAPPRSEPRTPPDPIPRATGTATAENVQHASGETISPATEPTTTHPNHPLPAERTSATPDARNATDEKEPPLDLNHARTALRTRLTVLRPRRAHLLDGMGSALAEELTAHAPLPRFDVSAMDGYAVAGPGPWTIRRDIGFAGGERPTGLLPGEAVRIATGAHVPEGTSRVVRDEFTRIDDPLLSLLPGSPDRSDIRRRGEDREPGDVIAPAGTRVTPALVSAAASVEVREALIRGPLAARIVMTGDEIRAEGPLHPGQTRDSIGPILPELLAFCGVRVIDRVHLRDTAHGFDAVLAAASDCDLLLVVGATGGGAADQLRGAVARTGARVVVPRLRLRPGGSTVVAETGDGTTVLGLPGNPYAAVATLLALTPAIVAGRTGAQSPRPLVGPLRNAAEIAGPVPRIVPARCAPDGGWIGDAAIRTAHLGGLVDRDGLVIVPAGAPDDGPVEFVPLPA